MYENDKTNVTNYDNSDSEPMEAYETSSMEDHMHSCMEDDILSSMEDQTPFSIEKQIFSNKLIKNCLCFMICILISFLLAKIITTYVIINTEVDGSSMEHTLLNGDSIIINKLNYQFHEPKRFDIIVFPYTNGVNFIKRIIGLPNETVQIKEGKIYINGRVLTENYGNELIRDPGVAKEPILLSKDEYFVLGDNRNKSMDSRTDEVGTIVRDKIIGKAWIKIWPLKQAGLIKHQ